MAAGCRGDAGEMEERWRGDGGEMAGGCRRWPWRGMERWRGKALVGAAGWRGEAGVGAAGGRGEGRGIFWRKFFVFGVKALHSRVEIGYYNVLAIKYYGKSF